MKRENKTAIYRKARAIEHDGFKVGEDEAAMRIANWIVVDLASGRVRRAAQKCRALAKVLSERDGS